MERWVRLYLSVLLVPLGFLSLYFGATRSPSQNSVAVTLTVLGAGMMVFGVFGPRMEGRFKIGPSGAEAGLSEATEKIISSGHDRLKEAAKNGEIPVEVVPKLEEAVTRAAIGSSAGRRRYAYHRSAIDPAEVGKKLADAILEAAKVQQDPN